MSAWSSITVTLSVHVFVTDGDGDMTVLDPPSVGAELAGFEAFRVAVWGSNSVRALGAEFFPSLASGDLEVPPERVAAFLEECGLLRANLDAIAPATEPGHSHDWYLEVVSTRLANIEAAAQRALEVGGGVLIW
jgi:hypothetical protein